MNLSPRLAAIVAGAAVVTAVSLVFASQGVRNGPSGPFGTVQPEEDELLLDLDIQAAYDDQDIVFRFSWDSDAPSLYHDYLVYEGGEWVRYGGESDGSAFPLNEDRVTFLLDDGSIDGFEHYGGFMTVYSFTRYMSPEDVPEEEVDAVLGEGTEDLRKMLPDSMEDPTDWRTQRDEDELADLQNAGYFLDLWHWRSHRSNPIGWSDDQWVLDARNNDEGSGVASTNWDGDLEQPQWMFDPDQTGQYAMSWDRIQTLDYTMDDPYYLSEFNSVPFDPDHEWQDGDAIPRRFLSEPEGSRAAIFSQATIDNGRWTVELRRALDTGSPQDDKILEEFGRYDLAPAVHAGATAGRWHYVGMPVTLGLGRSADVEAVRFSGDSPDWSTIEPATVTLFYPGVIGWDYITDRQSHSGADAVNENRSFYEAHTEDKMAFYGLESEFRDEIISQWFLTTIVWTLFILAVTIAFVPLARRYGRERTGSDTIVRDDALRAEEHRA